MAFGHRFRGEEITILRWQWFVSLRLHWRQSDRASRYGLIQHCGCDAILINVVPRTPCWSNIVVRNLAEPKVPRSSDTLGRRSLEQASREVIVGQWNWA